MSIPSFIEIPATNASDLGIITCNKKQAFSLVSLMKPSRRDCRPTQPPPPLTSLERWSSEGSSSRRGETRKTQTLPRLPQRKRESPKNGELLLETSVEHDSGDEESWESTETQICRKYPEQTRVPLRQTKSEGVILSFALRDHESMRFRQRDESLDGVKLRSCRLSPPRQPQRSSSARRLVVEQSCCTVSAVGRSSIPRLSSWRSSGRKQVG